MRPAMEQVHVAQKAVHKRAGRMVPHLLGCAALLDTALVDDDHAVGHLQRLFLVVVTKMLVTCSSSQAAQPAAQFLAHLGIERARRARRAAAPWAPPPGRGQGDALALPPESCEG